MEPRGTLHQVPPPPDDDQATSEDAKYVLEAVRDVLDEQRASAERLRSSARQTFVFVSVLFTIAQTAVFTNFDGTGGLSSTEKGALLVLGIAAVAGVATTGLLALAADALQPARAVAVSDIVREVEKAASRGEPATYALIDLYDTAIKELVSVVDKRRARLSCLSVAAALTIGFVVVEIAVALLVRIP
jgi:hypothetical protein